MTTSAGNGSRHVPILHIVGHMKAHRATESETTCCRAKPHIAHQVPYSLLYPATVHILQDQCLLINL